MCEKHYYYAKADGVVDKQSRIERCDQAIRRGRDCETPMKFRHPKGERPPPARLSGSHLPLSNLPPSPPSSDTSFPYSGSEAERSHKRRSGIYVNGAKVFDVSREPSRRERRNSNHVVIVEPPASPRTPPRYDSPLASPSNSPAYTYDPRPRLYPAHTRPEVRVEVNDHRPRRKSHSYYTHVPKPRRDSLSYNSGSVSEEEIRFLRARQELKKAQEAKEAKDATEAKEAARRRQKQAEIARANEDIANRPAVPTAPQALSPRYRRGSVSVRQTGDALADAMRNVRIQETAAADAEKERRRREKRAQELRKQEEDEAQRQRLLARMAPQAPSRSNSVAHGATRRPKIVYEDELYRKHR
ncbi:hypothetical protein BJ170DRAFT_595278 [Xylariales sp. AK1849]|nr:hypothetical protein BJ170DRAFT_595278 [Xylariales sp. AK1849]